MIMWKLVTLIFFFAAGEFCSKETTYFLFILFIDLDEYFVYYSCQYCSSNLRAKEKCVHIRVLECHHVSSKLPELGST